MSTPESVPDSAYPAATRSVPAEPTEPAAPAEPTDPVVASASTESTESTGLTVRTGPAEPMGPTVPAASTELAEPAETDGSRDSAADPFEPDGVVFSPVSPRLVTARLLLNGGFDVLLLIVLVVLGVVVSPWFHIGTGLVVALLLWELWLIPRQVRAMGYALTEDHLLWRKGIMFRRMSVVPYGRMQFVDTSQGPLAHWLGIAEVELHTAAASTDATINGLPVEEAEHLRRLLSERGEQRMAGL